MATSNSVNFSLNRSQVIKRSLQLLGIVGSSESVSSEDDELATDFLNMLIKEWQAQGIHLWALQEATLYLTKSTAEYVFSSTGANASDSVVESTLSAAYDSGVSVITVASTTGMTANDNILVELDNGAYETTTITTVDSATQLTLASALDGDASQNNEVYTFTTKINQPLDITSIRRREDTDDDIVLEKLSRDEYFNITDKDSESSPIMWYFDRQLLDSKLYLWPTPNTVKERLKITYRRKLEDMDAGTNDFDFPAEWTKAIVYNLALDLAPLFGKEAKAQLIAPIAQNSLQMMLQWDNEHDSVHFVPDMN